MSENGQCLAGCVPRIALLSVYDRDALVLRFVLVYERERELDIAWETLGATELEPPKRVLPVIALYPAARYREP